MKKSEIENQISEFPKRQGGAQSVRRTIDILRSVSKYNETGARLSKIANDVNLPPPTVHRILTVLREEDFLSFDAAAKLYHLGSELYSLGATTRQFSLRDRFHTTLNRISELTDNVIHLVIHSGYDGLCIDRTTGQSRVQVLGFNIGERRLLGIGAAGQALLAFLPEKQQKEIIKINAPRYLKYYDIHVEEVRSWIKSTKEKKYSNSIHVVSPDTIGVGVPIFNQQGHVVAAISMAAVSTRMTPKKCRQIAKIIKSEIEAVEPPPN